MKSLNLILLAFFLLNANALAAKSSDLESDFDSLGGNKSLVQRAKEFDPKNKTRIVQKRTVDRNMRLEVGADLGMMAGGDSYITSQHYGAHVDFHFTPHWSLGARYYEHSNQLTNEGKGVFDEARRQKNNGSLDYQIPDIDFPLRTSLAVINFYPIYGKLNLFDMGVAQFDMYLLVGAGQVQLESGSTETYAAGIGAGIWMNQHVTTRMEFRYQNYQDEVYTGTRDINAFNGTISIGFML